MTLAEQLACFTVELRLSEVPADVTESSTWLLADTLACALAAVGEPAASAVEIVINQAASERALHEATVIGQDWKSSLRATALVNCTLARYIDANDIYMPSGGTLNGSGHFSDAVPALVAAAEAVDATGSELLEAAIISYETQAALADSLPWLDRGFHSVSQVTVAVALAAGRLLGLSERELAHAASLAITTGLFVQSWLRPADDVPAIKGGASGLAAERGVTCARLAGAGFTGPLDAFETFYEHFGSGAGAVAWTFERLGREWTTPRNAIKPVPAQIYTQAVVQCAELMYRGGLRLAQLERLTVYSNSGACARVQGSPGAFRPLSREAADHSTPFVTAMTLRDGEIGPSTYHGEPWRSAEILDAMSKMTLVVDESWAARLEQSGLLGAEAEAVDTGGRHYHARVDQFRGHPDNPLTREEFGGKLERCLEGVRPSGGVGGARLLETCEALPTSPTVQQVVECLSLPRSRA